MATTTAMTTSTATPRRRRTEFSPLSRPGACVVRDTHVCTVETHNQNKTHPMIIAEITGNIASAAGLIAAAIAVGMIGTKAAEAVGRNPAASGKILVQSILGMALAEGLGLLALFLAK